MLCGLERVDPPRVEGPQDLSVAHDPQGMWLEAEEGALESETCPPNSETSGTCVCARESPVLVGSCRRDVAAMGRPSRPPRRAPMAESDISLERRMVAQDYQGYFGRSGQRLNCGHRGLGKRRWDDMSQKVVDEQWGETPCCSEAADREGCRELEPVFIGARPPHER